MRMMSIDIYDEPTTVATYLGYMRQRIWLAFCGESIPTKLVNMPIESIMKKAEKARLALVVIGEAPYKEIRFGKQVLAPASASIDALTANCDAFVDKLIRTYALTESADELRKLIGKTTVGQTTFWDVGSTDSGLDSIMTKREQDRIEEDKTYISMSPYTLRDRYQDTHPQGHFFDEKTLAAFGETMSKMSIGHHLVKVESASGVPHTCIVLHSKQKDVHGTKRLSTHYFDVDTYDEVITL